MPTSPNISPTLGVNVDLIYTSTEPLPVKLGTTIRAQNGRLYIFAQAAGTVANDTAVVLTESTMTFVTGAGAWSTRAGAVTSGQRCWLESNAIY